MVDLIIKRENFKSGNLGEIKWINKLRKKYPNIFNNNTKDKFAKMDAYSNDNDIEIEHEHKQRNIYHNQYEGLMVNKCKIDYSIKQLQKGIRQIYYWTCKDGLFFWELTDIEKQKDEIIYNKNGNYKRGDKITKVVDIKTKYLKKYEC